MRRSTLVRWAYRWSALVSLVCAGFTASAEGSAAFTAVGWGDNSWGQLNAPASATEIVTLAAGDGHVVALRTDGQLVAWGRNDVGQTTVPTSAPGTTAGLQFGAVAAGPRHTLALSNAGLLSWGDVTAVPVVDLRTGPLRAIAAGGSFNVAVDNHGKVTAAGRDNRHGQLNVPAAASADIIAVAAGEDHVLALKSDGRVVAWGRNDFGQASVPATAGPAFAIAAGPDFSVALLSDGKVVVWGRAADTHLKPPAASAGASKIAAGADFLLAQTDTGLIVWGAADRPTLGTAEFMRVAAVAAGGRAAYAVRAPYFTQLPGVVRARPGERVELSAAVSHTTGLTAYWGQKMSVPGTLRHNLGSVTPSQSGSYTVTAEYETGYIMTATGLLIVSEPPVIEQGPGGTGQVQENESTTFWVTVHGTGPFTFQWLKDGVEISGATAQQWTLQAAKPSDAGRYSCRISNSAGVVETGARELLVFPARTGREDAWTVAEPGATVTLRFRPGNHLPPYRDFVWTKDDQVIPGATGPEWVIKDFAAKDVGLYRVHFTDGGGQTGNFTLFHLDLSASNGPPYHGWLDFSEAVMQPGSEVTMNLFGAALGYGLKYRWQVTSFTGETIVKEGEDLTSLTFKLPTARDRVVVQVTPDPRIGGSMSAFAWIWTAETAEPDQVLRFGGPSQLLVGESGELVAEYPGMSGITWKKDGVVLAGKTSPRLAITNATKADAGTYVMTANTRDGAKTVTLSLGILELPRITSQPRSTALTAGEATLSVDLSNYAPSGHQVTWFRNGQEFFVSRGWQINPSTLTTQVPGTYFARVYLNSGYVDSAPAVVSAAGSGVSAKAVQPGVYLGERGAFYVRSDRSVAVAAGIDWRTVAWLDETVIGADGRLALPAGLFSETDDTLAHWDRRLTFGADVGNEGDILGYCAEMPNQTLRAYRAGGADRRHEGFYRGAIPGTTGGKIWVFVSAEDRANVYLHDGYDFYAASNVSLDSLDYNATDQSVTYTMKRFVSGYGDVVVGRFVAHREQTVPSAPHVAMAGSGSSATLIASGVSGTQFSWRRNGMALPGEQSAALNLPSLQPAGTGLYTASASSGGASVMSRAAIVGVGSVAKVIGAGSELQPANIQHPNGNIYDQVLMTGSAAAITSDHVDRQITRMSFIDLDDDIVQVEFSGPGTLSLVLDQSTPAALPAHYNQAVKYVKGHPGIVITGATRDTHVSVFSVGRFTATNQSLFRNDVKYDGVADIAFIAIASIDGRFGGVRTANANYFANQGLTGLYAPGVRFEGPVFLGDVSAFGTASPVIELGSAHERTWITGGDLSQPNGKSVQVSGLTRLQFKAGTDSHGNPISAATNRARLEEAGKDVTAQIVVNP